MFDRTISNGPATHAVVIGCGRFPWVSKNLTPDRPACFDSAVEVIRFLAARSDDLIAPLATIDCLLADPSVNPDMSRDQMPVSDPLLGLQIKPVDRPLAEQVEELFERLRNRCRAGDAIFIYLTSHGVAGRDEAGMLALEDFGKFKGNPSSRLLNVKSLAQSLPSTTAASSVWIFMDACQELADDIVNHMGGSPGIEPFKVSVQAYVQQPVTSLALAAVHHGGTAYAPRTGGVAYFTRALLEGLGSCCVEWREREWRVTAQKVLFGLDKIARALDGTDITPYALLGFNREAHLLRVQEPSIPVHIGSRPETVLTGAVSACLVDQNDSDCFQMIVGQDWRFRIPPRPTDYRIRIEHPGGNIERELFVETPAMVHEVAR